MRHGWFRRENAFSRCPACGSPECLGRLHVDFCPLWQEAEERQARGEFLPTFPVWGER